MTPMVIQLSRGTTGVPARVARTRAAGPTTSPMPTGPWTWIGPLLVTLLGGIVRFYRLGRPHAVVFDETYYVKDAWSLLHHGAEQAYVADADAKMLAGNTHIITNAPTFVVHPPDGKWLIGLGEWMGGLNPFGWRLAVALVGTASIFLLARIGIRFTRSILLGCLAGLLLALDGLAVVMSRTALLDGMLMFWVLAAFGCLLVDRDRTREALAVRSGPAVRLGLRPWRLGAGLCFGIALGTKWSALFFLVVFGVMALLWDIAARRAAGEPRPYRTTLRADVPRAALTLGLLPLAVYLASWTGWLMTSNGWSRHWAANRSTDYPFIPAALRSLWHYHSEILYFHTHLTEHHPYQSSAWGWTVLARPVAYYSTDLTQGAEDCHAASCTREVLGIGTPVLWWAATAALVHLLWRWAGVRDWRAGAVLAGVAAGWLPWFRYGDRPIFYFYAIAFLPFLILGLVLSLGCLIGPEPEPAQDASRAAVRRRAIGASAAGALVVLIVVNFFYIYPVLSAGTLSQQDWLSRMWFRSWI
jgi:dolichyl-phosphate-mannose--protein O-mannosyl transferase